MWVSSCWSEEHCHLSGGVPLQTMILLMSPLESVERKVQGGWGPVAMVGEGKVRAALSLCPIHPLGLVGHHRLREAVPGGAPPAVGVSLCQGPAVHRFPFKGLTIFTLTCRGITELRPQKVGHPHRLDLIRRVCGRVLRTLAIFPSKSGKKYLADKEEACT